MRDTKRAMDEQALSGGNMGGAVRVGSTVRKPAKRQSATIQRLLAHVRAQGVTWVTVARRLRQWHDATASFERQHEDVWWWPGKLPAEVICHVDFAPYNHVFREGEFVGAIDFDICYPGPRLWDLAYTAYRYLPLTPHVDESVVDGSTWGRTDFLPPKIDERIHAFLHAYAGDDDRLRYRASALLGYLPPRLIAMADWCDRQDDAALRRNGVMYRVHAAWIAGGARGTADVVHVRDA